MKKVALILGCLSMFGLMIPEARGGSTAGSSNLTLSKSADQTNIVVGNDVEFSITVTNLGSDLASNIQVQETLPAGLSFVAAVPPSGSGYDPGTAIWTITNLAGMTWTTLSLTAQVLATGAETNSVTIIAASPANTNLQNSAKVTVYGLSPLADLAVIKTVSQASANVGQQVQFYITVTNLGPNGASNVVVEESMPPGLLMTSATNFYAGSYYDTINGLWHITNLPTGVAAQLDITAQVNASGEMTNTVSILVSSVGDPNPGNNAASSTVNGIAPQADLAITTAASVDCASLGQPVDLSITVTHLGLVTASNIVVQELLPGGLSILASNVPPGTVYDPTSLQWSIPSLTPGEAITLVLTVASSSAGLETNSAYLVASSPLDSNPANNFSSVVVPWSMDTTPPVLTCPDDITVEARGPLGAYVFYSVNAVDDCDGDPTIVCSIPSGSVLPVGQYTAVCVVTDASGNSNTCSFHITVQPTTPIVFNLSISQGTNIVLQWTGNSPPYTLETKSNLNDAVWEEFLTTVTTNVTLPLLGQSAFYRIVLEDTPLDPTDYDADRLVMREYYTNDPDGYWVTNGIPALARLADMKEDLGDDPMPAFEGMQAGYSEIIFTNALQLGLLPPDFAQLVNARLAEGETPWQALVSSLRTNVLELDEIIADNGTNDPGVGQIYQTLSTVFHDAFNSSALQALAPAAQKFYHFPPQFTAPDFIDFFGSDAFSLLLPAPQSSPNDNNTNVLSTWDEVRTAPRGTSYNASCVAHAVGPSAAKLGIIGNDVSAKVWNDLSKDLGATKGAIKGSAPHSGIASWYSSKGYSRTRAWNGPLGLSTESGLEEAKAALGRGCDVLVCYTKGNQSHMEMVTEIDILAGSDGYKGTVKTISWGLSAQFDFNNGSFSNKSDGARYRKAGDPESYLQGKGTADLYYFQKK
jgi:uncharacterized repeat protein (TIGR01451 family)